MVRDSRSVGDETVSPEALSAEWSGREPTAAQAVGIDEGTALEWGVDEEVRTGRSDADGELFLTTDAMLAAYGGPAFEIGLDATQFGRFDEATGSGFQKFGTDGSQADDCERLGAVRLRHVGAMDLTWKNLTDNASAPAAADALAAVEALINTPANRQRWSSFFELLRDHGLRVLLTCIVYGGSRDTCTDSGGDPCTCTALEGVAEAWKWNWHPDHEGNVSNLEYLDICNEYELDYLSATAEAIGIFLAEVESGNPGLVAEVVVGLEVFNEVDDRNVVFHDCSVAEGDATTSGKSWGVAYYQAAKALREGLAGLDLPIYLPGVSPHYETVTSRGNQSRNSLDYRREFWTAFTSVVFTGYFLDYIFGDTGGDLADFAAGLNYHWDHRSQANNSRQLGPRHIGHLATELAMFREILDDVGMDEAELTVLQTGISVLDPDEYVPSWADRLLGGEADELELFQWYEVWRRLAGAMAAGAEAVGWEAWMSEYGKQESESQGKEFYGMGLRADEEDRAAATPSLARPRLSWLAYQRFLELFGNAAAATMIHPEPLAEEEFSPSSLLDHLVIIRFRISNIYGADDWYRYLLFLDSTWDNLGSAVWVQFHWTLGEDAADGECTRIQIVPDDVLISIGSVVFPDGDVLEYIPLAEASYGKTEPVGVPGMIRIDAGDAPVLLSANRRLSWALQSISTGPELEISELPDIVTPIRESDLKIPVDWYLSKTPMEMLLDGVPPEFVAAGLSQVETGGGTSEKLRTPDSLCQTPATIEYK